eukprot:scaffold35402_cov31-Tisochrysis_lutea.AAC.3
MPASSNCPILHSRKAVSRRKLGGPAFSDGGEERALLKSLPLSSPRYATLSCNSTLARIAVGFMIRNQLGVVVRRGYVCEHVQVCSLTHASGHQHSLQPTPRRDRGVAVATHCGSPGC